MKRFLALILASCLLLAGCTREADFQSRDLKKGIQAQEVAGTADLSDYAPGYLQLSAALLTKALEHKPGENVLLCPLSIQLALAMTANGAQGRTLSQMEALLGAPLNQLNHQLLNYSQSLTKDDTLTLANAIWFRDDKGALQVREDFLQTNADYYDCDIFAAPFDDSTLQDINSWVNTKTKGMIPKVLEELDPSAMLYLVNALTFEALWKHEYQSSDVRGGTFTNYLGQEQAIEKLWSHEFTYLENESFYGFSKPYKGDRYAFVGLLPQEGMTLEEAAATLTGESLEALLASRRSDTVSVCIPKFSVDFDILLNDVLMDLGVTDAFQADLADFAPMGTSSWGDLYISRVIHKTHLTVDQLGTKAAAVTTVEMAAGAAMPPELEVHLDQPFLYMILDTQTNVPLFMGLMQSMP